LFTYNLDNRGKTPLYVYLYNCIKADILSGKLKPDEKLPSKRSLSQHLKVSVITVENSYSQLLLEGYIYSLERKGYFVSRLHETLHETLPRINFLHTKKIKETSQTHNDGCIFNFKSNSISSGQFPFSIWARLMRKTLSEQKLHLLEPMQSKGIKELRDAISDYLYHFRGMAVSPEQIVIGAGTEYLYGILIQLLGRNRVFAVEDPGYQKIAHVYRSNDVRCEFIGVDRSGLSVWELNSSNADVVHITPAHHFPTGIVMPIKRRHELLKWASQREGRYIIEDDYDSEFRFTGRPIQTLQSIDKNQKVIYINTFSKSIAPAIRIGYMVLPMNLIDAYAEKLSFYSCTVPSIEQFTLAQFISEGYFERHINRMRNYYKKQRDLVIKSIKNSLSEDKITILEEDAGLHFLVNVNTDMSDEQIIRAAEKRGVRISCLSEYYYDKKRKKDGTIIINYSGIEYDKVEEAVESLMGIF